MAYTDYDDEDRLQVYRATPDGTTIEQLTHHTESVEHVPYLGWSPDDQKIAYSVIGKEDDKESSTGWVGIIDFSGMDAIRVAPDDFSGVNLDQLYWSQDSSRIMFLGESGVQPGQLYWVEAARGRITASVSPDESPVDSFDNVYLAGSIDKVIIQNYVDYYLFDRNTGQFELLASYEPEGFFLIREARGAPVTFSGERGCQSTH